MRKIEKPKVVGRSITPEEQEQYEWALTSKFIYTNTSKRKKLLDKNDRKFKKPREDFCHRHRGDRTSTSASHSRTDERTSTESGSSSRVESRKTSFSEQLKKNGK